MELIDTHAHLYLEQFEDDLDQVIERCRQNQVSKILLPNIDRSTITGLKKTIKKYPDMFLPMMGLHPCSVKEDYEQQLMITKKELDFHDYIAVGEIGLDYYWDTSFKEQQIDAFKRQVAWAKERQLPVAIHSRESYHDIIKILKPLKDDRLSGVFHCFTGSEADAQKAIDINFYLGIGGVLTFKNSGLDKTIEKIDLRHIIIETDAPYLAPAPFRGKRNESSYVKLIAEKLAAVKKTSLQEIARITTENAKRLFRF